MKLKDIFVDTNTQDISIEEAAIESKPTILSPVEQLLIGKTIKKAKATPQEPQMFYKIEGVFLNTFTIGEPILLLYTYLEEAKSYQIIEYQTGLVIQKPKPKDQNYTTLKELKDADHAAYFYIKLKNSKAYFEQQGAIITSVEIMLYFLINQSIKSRGMLNPIPENVLIEMRRPFMDVEEEEEDMFGE